MFDQEPRNCGGATTGLDPAFEDELVAALRRRGPDQSAQLPLLAHQDVPAATCYGSTLGMRGPATAQPLRGADDCLLLWNGEIFGGSVHVGPDQNDTAALMAALVQRGSADGVVACLAGIAGPWACIFWQPATRSVWFGHDRIGRRSLLFGYSTEGGVAISSVAPAPTQGGAQNWRWQELPPSGLYQLQLTGIGNSLGRLRHHAWPTESRALRRADVLPGGEASGSSDENSAIETESPEIAASADQLLDALDRAVRRRVEIAPPPTPLSNADGELSGARVAVLFSGGVDCMVIAALAHRHRPPDEPIDLLNVAFGSAAQPSTDAESGSTDTADRHCTPDRKSAIAGLLELRKIAPTRRWQLICVNRDLDISNLSTGKAEALPLMFPAVTVMDFTIAYALRSAAQGVGLCWAGSNTDNTAGGAEQLAAARQKLTSAPEPELEQRSLVSGARILLSGLGADEQCVGYKGRHRTRFAKGGWDALALEIERDIGRLWLRNLGRDDRMIADHGKEVRYPYLDEDVMQLLSSLPLWHLADLRLPDGVGDKRIIRGVSRRVGLSGAAGLPKRAIQFGSRSSKCFKCNSDGNAHVDSATLSDQMAGRKPKKQRQSYAQRRASKKNRGTQYPGRKAELSKGQQRDGHVQRDDDLRTEVDALSPADTELASRCNGIDGVPRRKWTGSDGITAETFFWEYQVANRPVILCPPLPKSWAPLVQLTKGKRHRNDTANRMPDLDALVELVGADTVVPVDLGADDRVVDDCSDPSGSERPETVRVKKTLGEFAQWWSQRQESSELGSVLPDGPSGGISGEAQAGRQLVWYLKDWHLARDLAEAHVVSPSGTRPFESRSLYEPLPHFAENFDWLNRWWDHLNTERRRESTSASTASKGTASPEVSTCSIDKGRLDDYRFVYLGPKGSWTPLHHDVLASYSWSVNLCGIKRWLLFPPEATPLLYDKHGLNLATDAREGSEDDRRKDDFPNLAKARYVLSVLRSESLRSSTVVVTFFFISTVR
eukprot:COSAG02_NODE_2045_length_10020_cov_2.699224_4_plen_1005_part_00